jgi:hypothetical protein
LFEKILKLNELKIKSTSFLPDMPNMFFVPSELFFFFPKLLTIKNYRQYHIFTTTIINFILFLQYITEKTTITITIALAYGKSHMEKVIWKKSYGKSHGGEV